MNICIVGGRVCTTATLNHRSVILCLVGALKNTNTTCTLPVVTSSGFCGPSGHEELMTLRPRSLVVPPDAAETLVTKGMTGTERGTGVD